MRKSLPQKIRYSRGHREVEGEGPEVVDVDLIVMVLESLVWALVVSSISSAKPRSLPTSDGIHVSFFLTKTCNTFLYLLTTDSRVGIYK